MSTYQQAPLSPTSISLSLVTELFSRFFSRLLENEAKYQIFLKEWEAFKAVLIKTPLDMDAVYIHLATVQLNLEKAQSTAPTKPSSKVEFPSSIKILPLVKQVESGHFDFDAPPKLNVNTSPRARSSSEARSRASIPAHPTSGFKPSKFGLNPEQPQKSTQLQKQGSDPFGRRASIAANLDFRGDTRIHSLPPSTFGEVADHSLMHSDNSSFLESYSDVKADKYWLTGLEPAAKTKYDLGYLASKARRITETVTLHSDKLVNYFEKSKGNVPGGYDFPEERTPLRRIVVYSAQSPKQATTTNNNYINNNLQDAMDQLTYKLQSNPKVMPFNNALITY